MPNSPAVIRLSIDGATPIDLREQGFYLLESPHMLVPPQRNYEEERYPEKDGALIYPKTSYEPFDYTVKLEYCGDRASLNTAIRNLWNSMFDEALGLRTAKQITLYNDYDGVVIVGYAKAAEGDDMTIFQTTSITEGWWAFDFTLRVVRPDLCTF